MERKVLGVMYHGAAYPPADGARLPREWGAFLEGLAETLDVSVVVYAPLLVRHGQRPPDFSIAASPRLAFSAGRAPLGGPLRQFLSDLRRLDAALVFLPGLRGSAAALLCRRARVPYIVYDGLGPGLWDPPGLRTRIRAITYRAFERFAVRGARGALVAGAKLEERLGRWSETRQTAPATSLRTASPPSQDKRRLVLFVGSLTPRKGVPELLSAWERIAARVRDGWELELIGAGPLDDAVARFARGRSDCAALGYVPHGPELFGHYDEAAILVLPSRNEAFPRVLVEGAAHGCALASAPVGGIAAAFGESYSPEWLIPGDVDSIVAGLSGLMEGSWREAGESAAGWFQATWAERDPVEEAAAFIRSRIPELVT